VKLMTIGERLREARERRGLSRDDISRETKIPRHVLEEIERNEIAHLPGGIVTRGYLRAFAEQVSLDPDDIIRAYRSAFEPHETEIQQLRVRLANRDGGGPGVSRALILLGCLVLLVSWIFLAGPADPVDVESVLPSRAFGEAGLISSEPTISPVSAALDRDRPSVFMVDIRPDGLCWVSAVADGRVVLYRLVQPGEHIVVEAQNGVALRVGDAGTFRYWIDGREGRALGGSGEAVTVEITADNHQLFLTPMANTPSL
jgi:cytoskeleton protein RodZ